MNRFPSPLRVEDLCDRRSARLLEDFTYLDPDHGTITAPAGFETDFASTRIVRTIAVVGLGLALLFSLFPWPWLSALAYFVGFACLCLYAAVAGYGRAAAVLHDFLYKSAELPRPAADKVFRNALRSSGHARWRAHIMWAGVRLGGAVYYGK